jgi:hypothetical protein
MCIDSVIKCMIRSAVKELSQYAFRWAWKFYTNYKLIKIMCRSVKLLEKLVFLSGKKTLLERALLQQMNLTRCGLYGV